MKLRATARPAGFSLIELLVAMVISLIVTLAITSVMVRSEGSKRSTTSVNDLNQNGAYAAYVIDRAIRNAGSGFSQSWSTTYGCLLDVSQGSTHVLPTTIPTGSAFSQVTDTANRIRLAPVIIGQGRMDTGTQIRGDALMVMGGTGGFGESPRPVTPGSVTAANLRLSNTFGLSTDDVVLLADAAAPGGGCMLQQVDTHLPTSTSQTLPLGVGTMSTSAYYGATGTNVNLTSFGASTTLLQLGNAVGNMPQFQLFGVGADNTLLSYDLLQPVAGSTPNDAPIADGVVEMRAIYGLDTSAARDGTIHSWADPSGTTYGANALTLGTAAAQANLRTIVAIKVGLILRTSLQERAPPTAASQSVMDAEAYQRGSSTVTLFDGVVDAGGNSLTKTRTLTGSDLNYRYRTVEVTVPLRNVMLAP